MPSDLSYSKILRALSNYERNTGQRHPLSLGIRDFKRAVVSEPLTSFKNQEWNGPISLGTPPVQFTANFDTGSSDFFVPGDRCESCGNHIRYNPDVSSTSVYLDQDFQLEYQDGSTVWGLLYNETITIAGLTATEQTFGAAVEYSLSTASPADGILGMAFRSISRYDANPVFQNLAAQVQTTFPIFAMKLTAEGSELTLGGLNPDLYTGGVTYVPVLVQGYWQISFDSFNVGGQVVTGHTPCIIDSVCSSYSLSH
jgi:cathepsin D